jgi:hypothetical protein
MNRATRQLGSLAAVALLFLATSCNTVSVSTRQDLGVPTYLATDPATVQILRTPPTAQHIRLGELTVQPEGNPTVRQIETKMQQAAAKIGANAVVIVADRTMVMGAIVTGPWWGRTLTPETGRVIVGVAIRFTQAR